MNEILGSPARSVLLLLAAVALLLPSAAPGQESVFGSNAPAAPVPEEVQDTSVSAVPEDPVDAILQNLDLKGRVAQLMMATMQGQYAPAVDDMAFLQAYTPGAVVIRQILKPSQAAIYVTRLRGIEPITGIPLLVGADIYELTRPNRTALSGFIQLPSLLSVAACGDQESTTRLARLLAEHMRVMGFNLHLGPSLALAPTLEDARGSVHCFGSDPRFTAEAASTILSAMDERGVLPMPMGFPGGGANRRPRSQTVSDDSPAVLLTPPALLRDTDLLPYVRAIEDGAKMLHVGNTLVPTLDAESRPASLSPAVLTGLLREQLNFEGVIVAGPLDSSDVSHTHDPAEAALAALEAGADMMYWRGPDNLVTRVVDRVVAAVSMGRISESLINAKVKRVLTLKVSQAVAVPEALDQDKIARIEKQKGLIKEALAVERRAITLVQNRGGVLPLHKKKSMPLGVTGVVGVQELVELLEKHMKPISEQRITTALHLGEIQKFEVERITAHVRGMRTAVCIFTDSLRPEGQILLVRELKAKGVRVVLVLLGYPKHLPLLTEADAILLAYCEPNSYEQTIGALADVLAGEGPVGISRVETEPRIGVDEVRTFDVRDLIRVPAGRLPLTISDRFEAGLAVPSEYEGAIKKVEWDFGTGKRSHDTRAQFAYSETGRYPVTLTVTERTGGVTAQTFHVVVE